MNRLRLLRALAAGLLSASGIAFAIGTHLERTSHHETAADHARDNATTPSHTPTPAITAAATSTAATPRVTPPAAAAVPTVTKDPRLSAPEGSKEREAGERAARQSKPTPAPSRVAVATVPAVADARPSATPSPQAPEGSAAREAAERPVASGTGSGAEASERLFGVNTEATALVASTVAVTALLAGLLLLVPKRRVLRVTAGATALFCAAAVALDLREVTHQHALGQTGVMTAALIVAALHVLAGAVAVRLTVARADLPVLSQD